MSYIPTIGLEIHIELKTKTKMFCRCVNDPFCRDPNIHICPVCLGLPGALPFPNQQAVLKTIQLGKVLNCQVASQSKWDRKNYFYPDLPKGFQISQYDLPFARNGSLELKTQNSKLKTVRIRRIHLEEDTGKLLHTKDGYSLIDYNRSGVPLVELVTEPDLDNAQEAKEFAQEIQKVSRHLEVSDANMEKGEMRIEANVSLASQNSKVKSQKLGTKVEIKNLNSFRSVERAIEYELKRQQGLLEDGKTVIQETRGWDEIKCLTYSQRIKETESDYRYFPEPDIPPINLNELETIIKLSSIETLAQKRQRYFDDFGLTHAQIDIILADRDRLVAFESVVKVIGGQSPLDSAITEQDLRSVAKLLVNRPKVIEKSADDIMTIARLSAHQQKLILDEGKKLEQANSSGQRRELELLIQKVLKNNPEAINDYRLGRHAALGFLMGQVMRGAKGKFEPDLVKNHLDKMLKIR